ncbi:MFS transporter [Microbispora siamensis]
MRASLSLRLARSAAFSVVCVLLAVGAHRFAGGAAPTLQVLLLGGLTVMAGATAVAGRERPPAAVIGLVLAAQVFLHELLGPVAPPTMAVAAPWAHAHGHALSVHAGMLTAHLIAALITGWWLSQGEAVLWSILRRIGAGAIGWLALLLAQLQASAYVPGRPRLFPYAPDDPPGGQGVLRHAVVRRGPPVLLPS